MLISRKILATWLAIGGVLTLSQVAFAVAIANRHLVRELTTEGAMLAGLMVQGDQVHVEPNILKQFKINPLITSVCVLDNQDALVAAVGNMQTTDAGEAAHGCRMLLANDDGVLDITSARATVTIANAQQQVVSRMLLAGRVSLSWYHLAPAFLMSGLLLAVLIGAQRQLKKRTGADLREPLQAIAVAAQRVSVYKDYSLRLSPSISTQLPTEMGTIIHSLNTMLAEIEDRDARLTHKSQELEKTRLAMDAANSAKSNFLANVGHELRTPLNAIIGFSRMLQDAPFGPLGHEKYGEYARDIHDSGAHLLEVINDILDLSKAESGKLSITLKSVSLAKIIEKALHISEGHAMERRIDIYTDIPPKLPKMIVDPVRLVQILLNLLSNALKFTPEGGKIIIRARAEPAQHGVHYFEIEIEDNGIGMTREEVDNVFVSFNQADAGLNRKYEGAGLGLPLAKRLVDLHHGKIKIDSRKGAGTTVTVRLPSDSALLD